ncbi:MAG: Ger(x)C family spore germination protein [Eubacterium sp.]
MSKSFKLVVLILAFCTLFSGCTTSRHLKDLVIVEGMGIDQKDEKVSVTLQTLNVGINNGSQTPQGNMTVNTEKEGSSITDSINNLSKSLSKRIFFGQNKLIVIGKSLAENDFTKNIDFFMRSADARSDVAVCISDSKAKDIIESKESDAAVPCENILYLIQNNEKSGLCTYITTEQILNLYADKTSDIFIPVLEKKKKDNVSTKGIGLFSKDKLVYVTDDEETTGFVILADKAKDIAIEAKDDKLGKIGVKISEIKCKKSAVCQNGTVLFRVTVSADMIVDEIEKGIGEKMTQEDLGRICTDVEKRISELCSKAFSACQKYNSDSVRLGEQLAKDDPDAYGAVSDSWEKYFQSSKIEVNANIHLKKISDNTQVE